MPTVLELDLIFFKLIFMRILLCLVHHAIRTFHLNHSVHSSVSEHQESTKSAKFYSEREKNKSILNFH